MPTSLFVFILLLVIADLIAIVATVFVTADTRENPTRFWLLAVLVLIELANLVFILLTYHHHITQHAQLP